MFEKYVDEIEKTGVTPEILKEVINEHEPMANRMKKMYGRYKQSKEDTPIFKREYSIDSANDINNKIANDWIGEIIDTKTGYIFGSPVLYQLEKSADNYQTVLDHIEKWKKRNFIDDLNGESGKMAAICGYDGQMAYIDREGQERVMRIDPWETVILSRGEITEPDYGFRYYETWDDEYRVEFYQAGKKTIFEGKSYDALSLSSETPLPFDYCPIWGMPNNAELMGDADKVITEIDAYDRAISDMGNEIEQFRTALMIFLGYQVDGDTLKEMKANGAVYLPDVDEGQDIKYLIKQLDPSYTDSFLDRTEKNIARFAKHVNFTEAFGGGSVTGPAMRYKLFMLESKAKTMERKHEAASLYMFKVLASSWAKKEIRLDYTEIDCKYTRNIPVNILDEAQAASALGGVVSKRTQLEQLSFITDVEAEMERIEDEKEEIEVDLDNEDLNSENNSGNAGGEVVE